MSATTTTHAVQRRDLLAVAVPREHGGWGLTLEPALLGLLVAPSGAGLALGLAGLVAFVARTPVRVGLVDRRRHRRLPRTRLAERVALVEMAVLVGLVVVAALLADGPFWVPLAIAAPLAGVALAFDMRSRSRRLVPELAGTLAVGSVVAAIVLADAGSAGLATGLWLVVAARAVASVPFVRVQLQRAKAQPCAVTVSDAAQLLAVVLALLAVAIDGQLLGGLVALGALTVFQLVAARLAPPTAAVLGAQQVVLGLAVVLVTGLWVLMP